MYYGLENPNLLHRVECPECKNIQFEGPTFDREEKFAWECARCGTVYEGTEQHLLQKHTNAVFNDPYNNRPILRYVDM